MNELVKVAMGGSWALVTGWMLPSGLGLAFFGVLVLPSLDGVPLLRDVAAASPSDQAVVLLAASVVLGLTLASLARALYRFLEGYLLWPKKWQESRITHHRAARERARAAAQDESPDSGSGALGPRAALALEKFRRYPDDEAQVAPTRLGNAIRRFEYYSYDRYQLSSQLLWSQIRGSVDERVAKEAQEARAGADFFVCLLYVSALVDASALLALTSGDRDVSILVVAVVMATGVGFACYPAAVAATDAWDSAVRGMIDLARLPLAEALGLELPATFAEEREMWNRVGWYLGYYYDPEGGALLDPYRSPRRTDD